MNEAIRYLRQILITRQGLLITADAFSSAVMQVFPLHTSENISAELPPLYKDTTNLQLKQLLASGELPATCLTDDFLSEDLPDASIAYHRISGFITATSRYYFSSKQLEQDLLDAEANDSISCHFFHINSGGGEAWYIDRLSETLQSLKKPTLSLIERYGASAAYYIGCQADRLYAMTSQDSIGCIGTMVDFYDWDGYFEKLGVKRIVARAHQSDLKNKRYDDLVAGKPEEYITEYLDPLNDDFLATVRLFRPLLKEASDDTPALRGALFLTDQAVEAGLIDGKRTFQEALAEAVRMAQQYDESQKAKKKALNFFNS